MTFGNCFNVANIKESSQIYGPGKRFVIWLQGCTLACKGCWNVDMWSSRPEHLIDRQALLEQILNSNDIEGVTFLGGEPLQQTDNLIWLLQQLRSSGLSSMLFSGYEIEEIKADPVKSISLEYTDILVSGRYKQEVRNINLLWRGSENQQVLFLSERYQDYEILECNQVEVMIDEFAATTVLGFPEGDNDLFVKIW
ncbi:4Fe-4S single cluster domain-containing protein [Bacterioplanoides sp. SCSIO 12839]|uniref:4Fe-4S single cluster domain-containing protein n=1 Tax=Bacterioplanoides sp. SCSIO 12839 TaxID=2829569 RepID=UPI002107843C|nr:4Fe-4S single cluster domain-containing protein [Bacterioplanoides sp. SCSIO 12839]UTW49819.1 radical SAM protein [Bacterioplanoides sp. SCSIO 12839]